MVGTLALCPPYDSVIRNLEIPGSALTGCPGMTAASCGAPTLAEPTTPAVFSLRYRCIWHACCSGSVNTPGPDGEQRHVDDDSPDKFKDTKYKEGDFGRFELKAETTDKLLIFATNGKFYTIGCDKLPGGRGFGEPIRLFIDLGNEHEVVTMLVYKPGQKLLVAGHDGRGFIVPADEVIAQTKNGKQVLSVPEGVEAVTASLIPEGADMLAVVGENRKLLVFKLDEVPEMNRGRGVTLQKYKDGGLSDARAYVKREGLTWRLGEKTRTETALGDWVGQRAQAGRLPPNGFPKNNKFG